MLWCSTKLAKARKAICLSTSYSTKGTTCLTPPILSSALRSLAWKPPNCGAGCWDRKTTGGGGGRGLRVRMEEVVTLDSRLPDLLKEVEQGAYTLPGPGWYQRLRDGTPDGAGEYFLSFVGEQVYARADKPGDPFSIECTPRPPIAGLLAAAVASFRTHWAACSSRCRTCAPA